MVTFLILFKYSIFKYYFQMLSKQTIFLFFDRSTSVDSLDFLSQSTFFVNQLSLSINFLFIQLSSSIYLLHLSSFFVNKLSLSIIFLHHQLSLSIIFLHQSTFFINLFSFSIGILQQLSMSIKLNYP